MNVTAITRSFTLARWRFEIPDTAIRLAPWVTLPLGAFVVYVLTLAPTVYGLDSAEFSMTAYRMGVPHATGYPLYIMLGKLFTFLPVGDIAYRVNLMSAVFAAGAVAVLQRIVFEVTRRHLISIVSSATFAFSFYFWSTAVIAEVYSLHTMLTGMVLLTLLVWIRGGSNRWLYAGSLAWGLSFGNHMSTVLTAPAFGIVVAMGLRDGRIQFKELVLLGLLGLPGLSTYLYVPWRYIAEAQGFVLGSYGPDGVFSPVNTTTLSGMWWLVSAQQFDSFMFQYTGLAYFTEVGRIIGWTFANFLGIGFVAGLLGLVRNLMVDRPRFVVLFVLLLANVLFFASYGAVDKSDMLSPIFMVWAVWMGEGLLFLSRLTRNYFRKSRMPVPDIVKNMPLQAAVMTAAFLVLPLAALTVNYSYTDLSSYTWTRDRYLETINKFEQDSLVFAWWPDAAPLQYLQYVEGVRTDIKVIDRFMIEPEDERLLMEATLGNRPLYVFGHIPSLTVPFEAERFFQASLAAHRLLHPDETKSATEPPPSTPRQLSPTEIAPPLTLR